ncbi:hypothetical protein [Bifidobacterium callitrichidarum]|uniref:DNA-binding protein n=1 Tax=Bifidobacterium callitrichidarum TaxID=2052941 RepID=A0A2U2N419_9BIFI|nr:hypothetical protein [Bifidobacterium callitrichidarum]PWG63840.1 hypothetical protein DF196_09995 [Bifidobacterium callitrichidarum]
MTVAHIVFSARQLEQAQALPRRCMDTVIASATDTPVSYWRTLRAEGVGPDYLTTVNGRVFYKRESVLNYIHAHLWRPES